MRQVSEAIAERRSVEAATERVRIEWQTKVLASFIAQTVDSEKQASALLKAADKLSMHRPPEENARPAPPTVSPSAPASDGDATTSPPVSGASARPGAFERLMAGFGGGRTSE